uniref:Uncharacterized protein n=1 Tax=Mycena chlorophos TaxID=658473 RepID=A0ABQ0L6D9_MYCCL|nr:predicted protein [Mycena chlorophos]
MADLEPPSPLPASSESTLVMTPPPLELANTPKLGLDAHDHGPLQPHISNLPRRKPRPLLRMPMKPVRQRAQGVMECPPTLRVTVPGGAQGDNSDSDSDSESDSAKSRRSQFAMSPISIPTLPHVFGVGSPHQRHRFVGPGGFNSPNSGLVAQARPQTPPASTPTAIAKKKSPIQHLPVGRHPEHGGVVSVVLSVAERGDDDAGAFPDVDNDHLDAIVRIAPSCQAQDSGPASQTADPKCLRIESTCAPRDDGVSVLDAAQLRAVCSFVDALDVERPPRIKVAVPSWEYAVDAFSVGLCVYSRLAQLEDRDAAAALEMSEEADPGAGDVHRLVWRWQDRDDCDAEGLATGWCGLLSREGLDLISRALLPLAEDSV